MKVTNSMRQSILNAAMGDMNKKFDKQNRDFKKRESALALQCYRACVPLNERKATSSLEDKWLKKSSNFCFNVEGNVISLEYDVSLPVPSNGYHRYLGVITGELAEKVMELATDKEKAKEENNKTRNQLRALLDSCTTFKTLKATWPQGEQFYKCYETAAKADNVFLPAVIVAGINAALGLKP